jgi:hypothetical protein
MTDAPTPLAPPHPAQTAARDLMRIFSGLAAIIAQAFGRGPRAPLQITLWTYINHTARRFARLMAHIEAGTLRPTKPRPMRTNTERTTPRTRLPQRRMWLVAEIGWRAAGCAHQLEHLLTRPDIATLIATTPRAQRLLRPLAHMLGLTLPCLPPHPRTRKPPANQPRTKSPRPTLAATLWYPNSEDRPMPLLPRRTTAR